MININQILSLIFIKKDYFNRLEINLGLTRNFRTATLRYDTFLQFFDVELTLLRRQIFIILSTVYLMHTFVAAKSFYMNYDMAFRRDM